jgi:peroxiredoxin
MIAAANIVKYPEFDRSEIMYERDLIFKTSHILKPLKAGNAVPNFPLEKENSRWQQFFNGVETHGPALLRELLNKTLVLAFYSNHWQAHGLDMLLHLNAIQHQIRANNANLLIVVSEDDRKLEKTSWDNSLSLNFYIDTNNKIAEKFGIYSENDPIWNRFSGIDANVPLLANYVITPYGKILHDYIDWDFSKEFPSKEIMSAVNSTTLIR